MMENKANFSPMTELLEIRMRINALYAKVEPGPLKDKLFGLTKQAQECVDEMFSGKR